jgi:hypothetical protein
MPGDDGARLNPLPSFTLFLSPLHRCSHFVSRADSTLPDPLGRGHPWAERVAAGESIAVVDADGRRSPIGPGYGAIHGGVHRMVSGQIAETQRDQPSVPAGALAGYGT